MHLSDIPQHVAIIMDGNGRWAEERGFIRTRGHREGAKRVDEIVSECTKIGIRYLTLYTFSTENWNRPSTEVSLLMRLLVQNLRSMDKKLVKNRVKLTVQGTFSRLPKFVQNELTRVIRLTSAYEPKMELAWSIADSFVGRAGAATIAESIEFEVPGILIPYPFATDNHQEKKAQTKNITPCGSVVITLLKPVFVSILQSASINNSGFDFTLVLITKQSRIASNYR